MNDTKVMPCPFCENSAEVYEPWVHNMFVAPGSIRCRICGYLVYYQDVDFIEKCWSKLPMLGSIGAAPKCGVCGSSKTEFVKAVECDNCKVLEAV